MTKRQLNQAIKNLASNLKFLEADRALPLEHYNANLEIYKKEFIRLHGADKGLNYMSAKSIKTMLGINQKYKFVYAYELFSEVEF